MKKRNHIAGKPKTQVEVIILLQDALIARDARIAELEEALELCLDDSIEVLNDYLQKYGETYRPHRITAQKETIAKAQQALAKKKETA